MGGGGTLILEPEKIAFPVTGSDSHSRSTRLSEDVWARSGRGKTLDKSVLKSVK